MPELHYEPLPPQGLLDAEPTILSTAFGFPAEQSAQWIEKTGRDHFRRVTEAGRAVGTLLLIPMGIFFGGASVPMTGIAAVAIDPASRGRRVARWMLEHALHEIRAAGAPLAGLYSAMHPLYRGVGFEHAGARYRITVPLHLMPNGARHFTQLTDDDAEAVNVCYEARARHCDGHLDRGPYCQFRIREVRGTRMRGFASRDQNGRIDAYIYCNQQPLPAYPEQQVLLVTDMGASTPAGMQGLSGFLRGFSSIATDAIFHGSSAHPILTALPDRRYKAELLDHWMLRVLDLENAISARGFPAGRNARVEVDLIDELFSENHGPWVIEVTQGRAQATRGGSGTVRVTARGLAALYSGFLSAFELAQLELVAADDLGLAALADVFPKGSPTMVDMF